MGNTSLKSLAHPLINDPPMRMGDIVINELVRTDNSFQIKAEACVIVQLIRYNISYGVFAIVLNDNKSYIMSSWCEPSSLKQYVTNIKLITPIHNALCITINGTIASIQVLMLSDWNMLQDRFNLS